MEDSEKIGIVRAIVNDAHYWVPAIVIIICGFYMLGRLAFVERQNKQKTEPKVGTTTKDSEKTTKEIVPDTVQPKQLKKMEPKDEPKSGDTYNVKSENQKGGVTAGRIDKVVIKSEDEIDPMSNVIIETDDYLTFRVKPKVGQWQSPFFMVPVKESATFRVHSQSGIGYDKAEGEFEQDGTKFNGVIFGFNAPVSNPATKDYHYIIIFDRTPESFIYGDYRGNQYRWSKN